VNKDTASALAEGEALLTRAEQAVEAALHPALAAIERWYAAHFHRHVRAGTAPLSADDKAALIQHVADAVANPAVKE
jgi:hypothetical protein